MIKIPRAMILSLRPFLYDRFVGALGLVFLTVILCGCGSEQDGDLGDWTLERGLTLTEDLRVSETDAFYFGGIADIAVRDDGHMAVADYEANDVKVLRPDGSLAHTLGQKGEGPGEFQQVASVQWARGDSLFAYDLSASRLTVFAPAPPHPRARTVALSREDGRPVRLHVREGRLVAEYIHIAPPDGGGPRYREVRFVRENGVPGDTLFRARRRPIKNVSAGEVIRFRPVPFGRGTEIAQGPDGRLYSGYQDSLRIVAHALDGRTEVIANVPTPPVPIPDATGDSVLTQIENDAMRQALAAAMPDTKRAFSNLVVASDGRIWMKRPAEGARPDAVPWWILDPETKTIRTVRLPPEVDLEVVKDGRAYGTTTTEMGAPALVRYRVGD